MTPEEFKALVSKTVEVDLKIYLDAVNSFPIDTWQRIDLDESEDPDKLRRNFNMAARKTGKYLRFKRPRKNESEGTTTLYVEVKQLTQDRIDAVRARTEKAIASRREKKEANASSGVSETPSGRRVRVVTA